MYIIVIILAYRKYIIAGHAHTQHTLEHFHEAYWAHYTFNTCYQTVFNITLGKFIKISG